MGRSIHEVQLNSNIPKELWDRLAAFCDKKKVQKKAILELALRRFLDSEDDTENTLQ